MKHECNSLFTDGVNQRMSEYQGPQAPAIWVEASGVLCSQEFMLHDV